MVKRDLPLPWILGTLAVGAAGALASRHGALEWYASLQKPPWTPPGWIFAPVWTALYIIMGTAAFLVWRERARIPLRGAIALYAAQLACNVLWPWLFFAWRLPDLAMLDLAALWVLVGLTLYAFHRVRPLAGWLLAPYLAWITFAGALNLWIWLLNG